MARQYRAELAPVSVPPPSSVDDFAADRKSRPKTRRVTDRSFELAKKRTAELAKTNDWSSARPIDFVALYAELHERVYEVAPVDLTPEARLVACSLASAVKKRHFDDDPVEMADFIWWTWNREKSAEKWRRENNRPGRRISYRLQFGPNLVPDYRLDEHRRRVGKTAK